MGNLKILQVNVVYNNGSTGKITYDIHQELKSQGHESIVCYGRGDSIDEQDVYKTCGEMYSHFNHYMTRLTGVMYGGCFYSTNKLISVIKKEKPDIVHLQCINGYFVNIYQLVTWLKNNHIKTVVTLHAEFMYTGGCGYALSCDKWRRNEGCGQCPRWRSDTQSLFFDKTKTMWYRMKKAFDGFDENIIITSVSPWLMNRAKQSPILGDKEHTVVINGLDTESVFYPRDTEELRQKHNIKDEKIIFHATPKFSVDRNHIKGGYYVLELAKRLNQNIKIIVAGPYDETVSYPENMIMLGKVTNQGLLARYYSLADVSLLTSQKETFSMVTAESLCCGTPVVGFKAGAPEQIALEEFSEFVDHGDIDSLHKEIMSFLNKQLDNDEISIKSQCYSKATMTNNYLTVYKRLCETNSQ